MNDIECPKCGEEENLHFNYNYAKSNLPIEDVLCNECGDIFRYSIMDVHILGKDEIRDRDPLTDQVVV